jgi:hypothetical protein
MIALIPHALMIPLSLLLAGVALGAAALSLQRFRRSYRLAGHYGSAVWFVRGIRCLIIALTGAAWAAGVYWGQNWLLIIGLVILAQELYEGFVLSAALREGQRLETEDPGRVIHHQA